ncbi:MAG TPA: phosphatase PAP2 family protein [Candidatus Babeliales bacterium]|nr:phosphatase PAP2 family protein [Candidatus Babeliales bacterium]
MNRAKKICSALLLISVIINYSKDVTSYNYVERRNHYTREKKKRLAQSTLHNNDSWIANHRITHIFGDFINDAIKINVGIFAWDSFKIFVTAAPFFVGARIIDEKLHNCFFDHKNKRNRNEPAQWCKEIARLSIGIPIALLGTQAFLSRNKDMQMTGQVFLTGMPFVLLAKDLIKKLDFDLCKRPFHEKFAKDQRKFGGFPSGHLAEATYTAVLYGMRYGPNFAVPLGSIAAFVTIIFLSSNRHYLSQMVAGAAFGAMYAVSANKLIDSKLAKKTHLELGFATDTFNNPAIKLSMKF